MENREAEQIGSSARFQPTRELKIRFEASVRAVQKENQGFVLCYAGEDLSTEDMIRHANDETEIGLGLLRMFERDEQKRTESAGRGIRARLAQWWKQLIT